jgi:hypothetical protein
MTPESRNSPLLDNDSLTHIRNNEWARSCEGGSNTSTVAMLVVGGDGKGTQGLGV